MISRAAVLVQINKPLCLMNLSIPPLKSGQVLVKVAYSGLCHSQLNEIQGFKGIDRYLPHTLGHEGSGIVVAAGSGVRKIKPGAKVVLTWIKGAGLEATPISYKGMLGEKINSGAISTFMNYAVISENRLVRVPERMPLREAALLGCAVSTGAGIVRNTARIKKGQSVAVFGVGGIGLSAILAARLAAAQMIIAIDLLDHKLEKAKKMGATHLIHAGKQDLLKTVDKLTQGRGLDFSIETAGKRETMELAFSAVREKGGLCILAGNLKFGEKIGLDPLDLIKGKRVIGTWGGETNSDKDIPCYASQFLSGRFNFEPLITHEYRLEEINRALKDFKDGKVCRALINMEMKG